jgi:lipopolysaccharide transport system permease protein
MSETSQTKTAERDVAEARVAERARPIERRDLESLPTTVIKASRGFVSFGLRDVLRYHELLYFLVWRDVKVRYKQTVVGILWVVIQPVAAMIVFNFIFGRLAGLPSQGIPYPLFIFAGILPWQLFVAGLTGASGSIVGSGGLISKVYFPRLIVPLSTVIVGVVDFIFAFGVLLGLMAYYGTWPPLTALLLPAFMLLAIATAFAAGLWLSMLNVQYRDVQYTIPFLTQIWFFLTPVAYSSVLIPPRYDILYHLNPMTTVVEGFRWALLGVPPEFGIPTIASAFAVVALLVGGLFYFRRAEKTFVDVI